MVISQDDRTPTDFTKRLVHSSPPYADKPIVRVKPDSVGDSTDFVCRHIVEKRMPSTMLVCGNDRNVPVIVPAPKRARQTVMYTGTLARWLAILLHSNSSVSKNSTYIIALHNQIWYNKCK